MADPEISSQQVIKSTHLPLAGRTILISPDDSPRELIGAFENGGARVITWPRVEIGQASNVMALDEAIDNLFGYDWVVFPNFHAVEYFLRRFYQLGRQISELDDLQIWALGTSSTEKLEASQVHVDLVGSSNQVEDLVIAFDNFLASRDSLMGINFLIPRAAHSCETLSNKLNELGARVDVVVAYRTAANDSGLVQLKALLGGGGVDCVVFRNAKEIEIVAELFDIGDLSLLFRDVIVAGVDGTVVRQAAQFGLEARMVLSENVSALADAITDYFGGMSVNL